MMKFRPALALSAARSARCDSLHLIYCSDLFLTDSLLLRLQRPSFPAEIIKFSSNSGFLKTSKQTTRGRC